MSTPDPVPTPSAEETPAAEKPSSLFRLHHLLRLIPFLIVTLGTIALFQFFGSDGKLSDEPPSIFHWLFIQYHDRDMALTWVMPLVALYTIWDRRERLLAVSRKPSLLGLLAAIATLALHVLAFRAQQPRISLFCTALFFWSSAWALWGWGIAKQLLFALGYTLLSFLCFHIKHYTTALQVLASELTVFLLKGFGIAASNVGSVIRATTQPGEPPIVFNVIEGCSGLRSLVVLSALAAPYAYFRVRGNVRAWLLFASSVPLAILTNIIRISTLTLFGVLFGNELAMQVYHDPAGFLVFFIGILLLRGTATLLERDWEKPLLSVQEAVRTRFNLRPPKPQAHAATKAEKPVPAYRPRHAILITALLLLTLGGTALFLSHPRTFTGAPNCPIDVQLPEKLGPYTGYEVLFCTNDQCFRDYPRTDFPAEGAPFHCTVCSNVLDTISIGERKLLPEGTPILRRIYSLASVHSTPFQVSILYSGIERNSIHRPQRCLVSQGNQIIAEKNLPIKLTDGSTFPVHVLDTIRRYKNDAGRTISTGGIYAYWYFNPERETPDHFTRLRWIAQDNILRDYRPRWAYISISMQCDEDNREPAYKLLSDVVPRLLPIMKESQKSLLSYE